MLSSSSDDRGDERRWKICDKHTGGALAWEQECKVLNCCTQKGTANPPSKIRMLLLDLLDAFCTTHFFVGYLDNLMSVLGIWKCDGNIVFRKMRLFPQNLVAMCYRDFDFQVG